MKTFIHGMMLVLVTLVLSQCAKEAPVVAGSMKADDPEATELFQKGQTKWNDGSLRSARKKFEELVEYHPLAVEAPQSLLNIGDIWMTKGEPVDAFEAYDKLITRYPSSPLYATALKKQEDLAFGAAKGDIQYDVFWLFPARVDTSKVIEMLTKLRDNAPYAPTAPKALFELGQLHERVGGRSDDLAIEAYHKLIDLYPTSSYAPLAQMAVGDNLLARMNRGSRNKSNLKSAQEAYEDFLQRFPSHSLAGKARDSLADVRWRLATLNLDIAKFYLKSGNESSGLYYLQEAAHDPYNKEVRDEALALLAQRGVSPKKPKVSEAPPEEAPPAL